MKAVRFKGFGGPEVLETVDDKKPVANRDELLIKVHSAGLNPIDAKIREGSSFVAKSLALPAGMGFDVCGEVEFCGEDISEFKQGDLVLGTVGRHNNPSAYSEYCVGREVDLIILPKELDSKSAGGIPIASLTAWQALFDHGQLKEGEKVLIHAGAGGVGHFAVQFAKWSKAYVVVTASENNHAFLKELGVDELVDYNKENFEEKVRDVDLVIDLVGGDVGCKSFQCLKKEGRLVTVPTVTADKVLKVGLEKGHKAMGMLAGTEKGDLKKITDLMAKKDVTLCVSARFSLDQAAEAHKMLEERHTQGKIVLVVE